MTTATEDKNNRRIAWIDLDDTLWDFKSNSRVALGRLYEEYNLGRWFDGEEEWVERYEIHNHRLWDEYSKGLISKGYLREQRFLCPLLEAGSSEAVGLGALFDNLYLDKLAECTLLVEGAIELMSELRNNGWKVGILSNGFTEVQYRKINGSGLSPYVDYIVLSDEVGFNKPDVRIFSYAERLSGCDASHSLMIGDNPDTDIAGALAAGWSAVLFTRDGASAPVPTFTTLGDIAASLLDPVPY